ncbi:RNA pseudouridylate synthase [Gracilaria domingensis]|nr:RNA pseudouridylate synthase [Gracilaria domingensis]
MGFASRRGAEKLIEDGYVHVNNKKVTQQGTLVVPGKDTIHVDGKLATPKKPVWVAVHKPRGMNSLPSKKRRSVDSGIPTEQRKGLIPIAGIEEDSSGLLILSNDRTAVAKLNNPDNNLIKEWIVDCYGQVPRSTVNALQRGIRLEGEEDIFRPKSLQCLGSGYIELSPREKAVLTRFIVCVREHRRQLMSRIFSAVGLTVARASRRSLGPVLLSPLKRGDFRYLTPNEIKALKRGVKERAMNTERRQENL